MHLAPHRSYRALRFSRDSAAVRDPGQVSLRQTRAGIQKEFDYIELSLDSGSRPPIGVLVRNDGFGAMSHSFRG